MLASPWRLTGSSILGLLYQKSFTPGGYWRKIVLRQHYYCPIRIISLTLVDVRWPKVGYVTCVMPISGTMVIERNWLISQYWLDVGFHNVVG